MIWLGLGVAFIFLCLRSWSLRDKVGMHTASGMTRSPLFVAAVALTTGIVALSLYMATLPRGQIHAGYWIVEAIAVVAVLALRKMLRWRFPY